MKIEEGGVLFKSVDSSSTDADKLRIFLIQFFYYVLVISCILLTGTCKRNITCDCDKKTEEKERPERQAAIFAKEFQDKLYRTIFTKENDDKDPPTNKSTVVSTTPSTTNSPTNCSNDAKVRIETIVAFIW